jgi:diguanylate cyclase (GGDEF)-like protein
MTNPLRSLAARVTLLVFLATVTSSLTVSLISAQALDGFLRHKIDQRFPQLATQISNELDQWYTSRSREIEVFAGSAILTESTPELEAPGRRGNRARDEAGQYLSYVLDQFPHFSRLVIATPDGRPLTEVGEGEALPPGFLAATMPQSELTGISDAQRISNNLLQIISTPMHGARGETIAQLYAMIDLQSLNPMLKSDELGDTATVFLVDRNRHFINPPEGVEPDALFKGDGETSALISSVAYYDDPLGLRVVGTRHAFPRFEWTLVVEQPYDEAFAPIVSSMSRVAGMNLVIVLAVALVAYRIAGSIVRPLRALSHAAKRLSDGEREVEIEETTFASDEVNTLTRTFNEMSRGLGRNAAELEANQREIEGANQRLVSTNEELSNMNLVLEQLSITDGLTKLHNHRYFQEAIAAECKRAVRTSEPLCLILIDIDFFKKWNDRLGHAGGDEILRRMAEILNVSVRETDLLARYGGEEFALLAINTDLDGAAALGEKVRQAVAEGDFVTDVPSEKEQPTVSVGVACFGGDRRQLFIDADTALYAAKDAGRNQVIVAQPTNDSSEIANEEINEAD